MPTQPLRMPTQPCGSPCLTRPQPSPAPRISALREAGRGPTPSKDLLRAGLVQTPHAHCIHISPSSSTAIKSNVMELLIPLWQARKLMLRL